MRDRESKMERDLERREAIGTGLPAAAQAAVSGSAVAETRLIDLTATAAVRAMRQGEISSERYAAALLARAEAMRGLNAFLALEPDQVLAGARAADAARAAGRATGLLHGLPIAVKDSVDTAALPTSNGTAARREFRPKTDAALVTRVLGQGAVLFGKTNMTELSFGWDSNNGAFGPVRNPYDRERIPGGSSGGSAAAVAARAVPLAIAADTLGSIRVPATLCGLAGLRPTLGRYPGAGIFALTVDKFDQAGPLARSVADLALFDAAVRGETVESVARPLRGARIGVAPFYMTDLDSEVARVTADALRRLRDAGAVIVEADVPAAMRGAFDVAAAIMLYETLPTLTRFAQEGGLGFDETLAAIHPDMQAFLKAVALPPNRPPQAGYEAMLAQREEVKAAVARHFAEQDIVALALPPIAAPPPRIGEHEAEIDGRKVSLFAAFGRNTALSPVAGTPALVLPAGMSRTGLPVGMEFNALPGRDRQLLALGLSLEEVLGPIPPPPD